MYVQFDNSNCQKFRDQKMPEGYYLEPNENGVAQVKEDVGKRLVDEYDAISAYSQG